MISLKKKDFSSLPKKRALQSAEYLLRPMVHLFRPVLMVMKHFTFNGVFLMAAI